jgi:hypothetical protein
LGEPFEDGRGETEGFGGGAEGEDFGDFGGGVGGGLDDEAAVGF